MSDLRDEPFVGLDVGSAAVMVVTADPCGHILGSSYAFHHGRIRECLLEVLTVLHVHAGRAVCTSDTPGLIRAPRVNTPLSLIEAARLRTPQARCILAVGAERFFRIELDDLGGYRRHAANSSCAAGTGSFLDQQAVRLGLRDGGELAQAASRSDGRLPVIASRCAVFARTDLIHAQQEGYSLEQICDGLCAGLARSIVDSVFAGFQGPGPVVFCGGVSRNRAVARHLEALLGVALIVDSDGPLYGAHGAVLRALSSQDPQALERFESVDELFAPEQPHSTTFYPALACPASGYPDFESGETSRYRSERRKRAVEVELFGALPDKAEVALGLDIGSTSTKAAIVGGDGAVLAGFYTRTAGSPIAATQALFEAILDLLARRGTTPRFLAAGTTGSGRKLTGQIIGADLVLDEISAHARAAVELDPDVDTIIEIGGQDSKFTTLRNGRVTFAQMNMVCAAGTGSFLEEQAESLGCTLDDYRRAEGVRAPLASDRCTVFMARDVHQLVARGFRTEEILAAVLHAVRENYLSKVAGRELGERVCFQGATARNRALVAVFEQRIGRRVRVSRFCHLTGAVGVALTLLEDPPQRSAFRGLGLATEDIPVRAEVCGLCNNHCRLRVFPVAGAEVAYGFLCGRDYETKHRVPTGRSGLSLLAAHRAAWADPDDAAAAAPMAPAGPVVGLPPALHMAEHLPLWRRFFALLGIPVVSSEDLDAAVTTGKHLARAEFCAPMAALHGHVAHLAGKADLIFLPFYLQAPESRQDVVRMYCYFTQFSPSVVAAMEGGRFRAKLLMPLVRLPDTAGWSSSPARVLIARSTAKELAAALSAVRPGLSRRAVAAALSKAWGWYRGRAGALRQVFQDHFRARSDVAVVLLGRPYTVLSPSMNKRIPDAFDALGIKVFFQDMVPPGAPGPETRELLKALHWTYAARIIAAADTAGSIDGLYPVLVTSFKCTPDSMVLEYFERLMAKHGKPYLVLQLDEHGSAVGYETRIEAAVRAFRNHASAGGRGHRTGAGELPVAPRLSRSLEDRVLLLPRWDPLTHPLLVAALRRAGIDARLLEEDTESIRRSMALNTGQCLPISIIVQECMETIRRQGIPPARAALWMTPGRVSCNFGLFAHFAKTLLERQGLGEVMVYLGEFSNKDISLRASMDTYLVYLMGGILRRLVCRIRPYEVHRGATDRTARESHERLLEAFGENGALEPAVSSMARAFAAIAREDGESRPQVAVFGDLYVRDNDVMNQDLIRCIEAAGGEVVTTPYTEFVEVTVAGYFRRWLYEGHILRVATHTALIAAMHHFGRPYGRMFESLLGPWMADGRLSEQTLRALDLRLEHDGESVDNILNLQHVRERHPGLALFVQAGPAYCCPALVTEAQSQRIEEVTGVPVVTVTYDGTGTPQNDVLFPYLAAALARRASTDATTPSSPA